MKSKKTAALHVGIIGAGLIGAKRAAAIVKTGKGMVAAVADVDIVRAKRLAGMYKAEAYSDWRKLLVRKDIGIIIVAVPNAFVKSIVIAALKNKKHILCEKPFGRNEKEATAMVVAQKRAGTFIKVGFNHRFHAAVMRARALFEQGKIGKIMFIRARYGHGGRPGMEKEWRFDKRKAGGGELLDQGAHVIDLAQWFGGDFTHAYGVAQTKFWKTNLEDNAFAILRNHDVTVAFHVSATNWKNVFSLEIYGDKGYLQIDGKGGSYGKEVLIYGRRNPGAAPEIVKIPFSKIDTSWEREWSYFYDALLKKEMNMNGDAADGVKTNKVVAALYRSSTIHKEIEID